MDVVFIILLIILALVLYAASFILDHLYDVRKYELDAQRSAPAEKKEDA